MPGRDLRGGGVSGRRVRVVAAVRALLVRGPLRPGRPAADPEDARVELLGPLEADLYRPHEGVSLLQGVVVEPRGQLVAERLLPLGEAAVVGRAELDDVVVRRDGPVAADD